MTSDSFGDIDDALGRELIDSDGQPLGTIREIFLDEATSRPAWAAVDAPGGGDDLVLAPLAHSTRDGDAVRVAVTRERVQTSPSTSGLKERFSADHMDRVRAHYAESPTGALTGASGFGGQGDTVSAGELPATMIRSEEAFSIERERIPRERVRLVKRIVTETVTQTVEVRREEVSVERVVLTGSGEGNASGESLEAGGTTAGEPASVEAGTVPAGGVPVVSGTVPAGGAPGAGTAYADAGASGPASSGEQRGATGLSGLRARASSLVGKAGERLTGGHGLGEPFTTETLDLTLYEEQLVISKKVVPRERIRIHREVVTQPQQITDDLRKERIEVERIGLDSETRGEGTERPDTPF